MSFIRRYLGWMLGGASAPRRLFDAEWYVAQYPYVKETQLEPFEHYIKHGAAAGLQPHPMFDGARYLRLYKDVGAAGINPLVHYVRHGWREGRSPHPLFDGTWYLHRYPEVAAAKVNPLVDFIESGAVKGRQPHPLFDGSWYAASNPELALTPATAWRHYLETGGLEGRQPSPFFDAAWYLDNYPDVRRGRLDPLVHYLEIGSKEGRLPHPLIDRNWFLGYADKAEGTTDPFTYFIGYGNRKRYTAGPKDFLAQIYGQKTTERIRGYFKKYGLSPLGRRHAAIPTAQEVDSWIDDLNKIEGAALSEQPDVSIVIPVFNEIAHTLACINSLLDMESKRTFEIIVGDDASTDETRRALGRLPKVRQIRSETNRGFIANCNAAAAEARGRYIAFLNNDTIVLPGWLDELVDTLERDPRIGLAGSKLIFGDGRLQEAGGIIWRDGTAWNYGRDQDPHRPEFSYLRDVDYISGASIMLPARLWRELGGFDDWYDVAYAEDCDLAFRVRQAGMRVVLQPMSALLHFEGVTSGTDVRVGVKAYQVSNGRKLYERWQSVLASHRPPGERPELERERNVKRRILVIDALTPTPDQDAGSVACYELMQAFQANGFKVSFLPWHNLMFDAKHTRALQRIGIEAAYYPYWRSQREYLEQNGSLFDIVLVFRNEVIFPALELLNRHAPDAKIIFHVADLHFVREGRQALLEGDAASGRQVRRTQAREIYSVIASDLTIVHSYYEKEVLAKSVPDSSVYVFPWIVDTHPVNRGFDGRAGIAFLGGYAHPPNVDAVLYFAEKIWPKIHASRPDIVFYVYGSRVPKELHELDGKMNIRVVGYIEDLRECFDNIRVSIAPLRYGAGLKGKVATAMSYGVPVVATSCAAEGMLLDDEKNVLIRDEDDAFADAVLRLYQDKDLWDRISAASIAHVEQSYSTTRGAARVREIIEMVLQDERTGINHKN